MDTVDGCWWINTEPYCNRQIFEQTLLQADDYRLTLLQLDHEDIEENGEGFLEAYTPRFRKRYRPC